MTNKTWDFLIIGGGHNGLVCANYLGRAKKTVIVLEARANVGGAAATEEVFPGYQFSRFSYVFSIFRKKIIDELFPHHWQEELVLYPNEPTLFIPTKNKSYLLTSNNKEKTLKNIAKFAGEADAKQYDHFYKLLQETAAIIDPLLDKAPIKSAIDIIKLLPHVDRPKEFQLSDILQLLNSSSANILNQWFGNEPLKAALSYSGTVGQLQSPYSIGSAFLQLHHVANTLEYQGVKTRFYPRGGMGAVSNYLAKLAKNNGVEIVTHKAVDKILMNHHQATGVLCQDGERFNAKNIISNCTYEKTFRDFIDPQYGLPADFDRGLKSINYNTNCSKINLVLNDIPDFICLRDAIDPKLSFIEKKTLAQNYMHNTLIVGEHMDDLHQNYLLAEQGQIPNKPTIQMLIPSLLDDSLTPANEQSIVCLLFVQYTPYQVQGGWSEKNKDKLLKNTIAHIEEYAPNFGQSIKHTDIVTPVDIENILGLTGGNIFQGAMDLDNLNSSRPMPKYNQYQTPISNLFSCSSANHPGGGVCGGAGRNAAKKILKTV